MTDNQDPFFCQVPVKASVTSCNWLQIMKENNLIYYICIAYVQEWQHSFTINSIE